MKQLFRLYRLAKKHLSLYCLGLFGASLSSALSSLAVAFLYQVIFDGLGKMAPLRFLRVVLIYAAALLSFSAVSVLFTWLYKAKAAAIAGELRQQLFSHIQRLPFSQLSKLHSGDLISRLSNDINAISPGFTEIPLNLVGHAFSGAAGMVYLTLIDWRFTAFCLCLSLVYLTLDRGFARPLRQVSREVQDRLSSLTSKLSDIIAGHLLIKALNLGPYVEGDFGEHSRQVYSSAVKKTRQYAHFAALSDFLFFASFTGFIGIGAYLTAAGTITVGQTLAAFTLSSPVIRFFSGIVKSMARLQSALSGADRLFEVLDMPAEPATYPVERTAPTAASVALTGVSFSYVMGQPVLRDISFSVQQGQTAALVGPSGSGKSTILKLILGFYPPESGSIMIEGQSLGEYTLADLREKIAYVSQSPYLFNGTIADNIKLGRRGQVSHDDLVKAAKAANAHDFIQGLPHGYETVVSENGSQLSGGQRQRIAIARAFLRDAPILLLDEATSALDNQADELVQQALDKLMADKTTMVITHRLATIKSADKIIVIDNGRIVEQGTHRELLETDGLYRMLQYQH